MTPRRRGRPLPAWVHEACAGLSVAATAGLYAAGELGSLPLALSALGALALCGAAAGWQDNRPGLAMAVALSLACAPLAGPFLALSHYVLAREERARVLLERRVAEMRRLSPDEGGVEPPPPLPEPRPPPPPA